jgi:hypothetical protein
VHKCRLINFDKNRVIFYWTKAWSSVFTTNCVNHQLHKQLHHYIWEYLLTPNSIFTTLWITHFLRKLHILVWFGMQLFLLSFYQVLWYCVFFKLELRASKLPPCGMTLLIQMPVSLSTSTKFRIASPLSFLQSQLCQFLNYPKFHALSVGRRHLKALFLLMSRVLQILYCPSVNFRRPCVELKSQRLYFVSCWTETSQPSCC